MRWDAIDWARPVPAEFLVPEHQYGIVFADRLGRADRIHLNHLAVCFSCEQAVFLERVLIGVLGRCRGTLATVPDRHIERFVREEERHIDAFFRVLAAVRPDLYPAPALRLFRWTRREDAVVATSPLLAFFLVAELFEECTLHIPAVMDERPEHAFATVRDTMRAHAREERGHVAIDQRALTELAGRAGPVATAAQLAVVGLLVAYVDRLVARAWRATVAQAARERGWPPDLERSLRVRTVSRSDALGVAAFAGRLRASTLTGGRLLAAVLERSVA